MRLLLDTHTFLWWIADDARLSKQVRSLLADETHDVYLSVISVWEIAIKEKVGKLNVPRDFSGFITSQLELNSFNVLSVQLQHVIKVHDLPDIHRDPFDRLLIAQALVESTTLLTDDAAIKRYEVGTLW
jgi:PIN domain nuclease of toxin-antitoxin system